MRATISTSFNYRVHYKDLGAIWKLSTLFVQHIPFDNENLVFCCIGTDRSTGDALGPLVGSQLVEFKSFPFPVIGTLKDPLHALNLEQEMSDLKSKKPESFIVAIDACLGKGESIGKFLFQDSAIHPGQGVGKTLPAVGNASIKGVVNVAGFMEQAVLQSTRLHLPFEMSRILARSLQLAHSRFNSSL